MQKVDGKIERLIVRRLDSELAEQDELALDRELIRNPAARDMLESYQRLDQLADDALHDTVGTGKTEINVQPLRQRTDRTRTHAHGWIWQLATGAIAAGLLGLLLARSSTNVSPNAPTVVENKHPIPPPTVDVPRPRHPGRDGLIRNASNLRPKIWRDTGREMFGVVGDDGNIYWIGIDRTRTARLHHSERM